MSLAISEYSTKMDVFTIAVFTAILLVLLYLWRSPKGNRPPGPRGLPLLGNVLSVLKRRDLIGYMEDQRRIYGNIFSISYATVPVVCVSGYTNIHEVFVTRADVCSGRPKDAGTEQLNGGHGILLQDGEPWKQMRRFTLTALRDLGFGKKGTEEKILEEVEFFVGEIDKFSGKTWDGSKTLCNKATSNVICNLIFGSRFEYTDPVFISLLQKLRDVLRSPDSLSIFDFLPASLTFLKLKFIDTPVSRFARAAKEFTREQVDKHRKTYDVNNIRDYVDCYIKVTSEGSDKVIEEDMFAAIIDMFLAGTETSATTLDWAMLYMMENPEIQTRCQKEIDAEVGRDRFIRMEDKKRLPYVEATMLEIMRHAAIVPLGVEHQATGDFKLHGYDIPKGTVVIANLFSALRDPEHWEQPNKFNPSRFLSDDGAILKRKALIPFSIGPRVCLGETLARTEVFLFFASLLQRFHFSKVAGDQQLCDQYSCLSLIRGALDYQCHVTKRD